MKILVTGWSGFVGSHLLKRLNSENNGSITLYNRDKRYDYSNYDIIYHIAGVNGKKGTPMETYQEPAIEMPKRILAQMSKGQKFVYMSSQYVVLSHNGGYLKDYEGTKLIGEDIVTKAFIEKHIDCRIIRPSFIYGKWDYHHLPLFKMLQKMGSMFPIVGSGKNTVFPTYVKDVTDVIVNAFHFRDLILPVAGEAVSMQEFINTIACNLGVGRPKLHIPALKIQPYNQLLRVEFFTCQQNFTSIIEPTPLQEGLSECIDWYKSN